MEKRAKKHQDGLNGEEYSDGEEKTTEIVGIH